MASIPGRGRRNAAWPFGRLGYEHFAPISLAVGALLVFLVSNDAYATSGVVRAFTDAIAAFVPSIDEFSRISNRQGTTRVVLAILWALVIPVAIVMGCSSTIFPKPAHELRALGIRGFLIGFTGVLLFVVMLPMAIRVPADFMTSTTRGYGFYRLIARSAYAMGMAGGFYCYTCGMLLGGFCRSLILAMRYAPDDSSRQERR
jgi:hypothetical protein